MQRRRGEAEAIEREIQRITNTASGGAVQGKTASYDRVPVLAPSDLTGLKAVRLPDETADIEMLVAIEGVIGKLVQNSGSRPARIAVQFEPCQAWRAGLPPEEPQSQIAPAADGRTLRPDPQAEPAADIESPFDDPSPDPSDDTQAPDDAGFDWTKE